MNHVEVFEEFIRGFIESQIAPKLSKLFPEAFPVNVFDSAYEMVNNPEEIAIRVLSSAMMEYKGVTSTYAQPHGIPLTFGLSGTRNLIKDKDGKPKYCTVLLLFYPQISGTMRFKDDYMLTTFLEFIMVELIKQLQSSNPMKEYGVVSDCILGIAASLDMEFLNKYKSAKLIGYDIHSVYCPNRPKIGSFWYADGFLASIITSFDNPISIYERTVG